MALGPLRGRHWAPADGPAGRKILGFVFCAALSFRESLTGLEHKFMTSMINKLVKLESGSSLTPASLIHFLIISPHVASLSPSGALRAPSPIPSPVKSRFCNL